MTAVKEFYKISPDEITVAINETNQSQVNGHVEGIDLVIFPHVYPSHQFRSTGVLLRSIKQLIKGKRVCDMGCGPGIVGLFALQHGAKEVVQADINPHAVANAVENNLRYEFTSNQVKAYLSNCFDNVPKQTFDLIIFPMPYHCDMTKIDDPLKYAFYDPGFASITKFLDQANDYSHSATEILISFSNKGDVQKLENIFTASKFKWELWKIANTDQEFDNRIYRLAY